MATWHTPATARDQWEDAPLEDPILDELLNTAQAAVLAYAPDLELVDDQIPDAWRIAQLRHARNIYRSEYSDGTGMVGLDGSDSFGLPARFRDLDVSIRELLRPRRIFGGPVG